MKKYISAGEFSLKQILVDAVMLLQVGLIAFAVHLVSLGDKHLRLILDTTPPNTRLRASKFVYLQL